MAGGGGIIRDHEENVVAGFYQTYGKTTNKVVEMRVLHDGLLLCKREGFYDIVIESDSKVVVDWIHKKRCDHWYLWDY